MVKKMRKIKEEGLKEGGKQSIIYVSKFGNFKENLFICI